MSERRDIWLFIRKILEETICPKIAASRPGSAHVISWPPTLELLLGLVTLTPGLLQGRQPSSLGIISGRECDGVMLRGAKLPTSVVTVHMIVHQPQGGKAVGRGNHPISQLLLTMKNILIWVLSLGWQPSHSNVYVGVETIIPVLFLYHNPSTPMLMLK